MRTRMSVVSSVQKGHRDWIPKLVLDKGSHEL